MTGDAVTAYFRLRPPRMWACYLMLAFGGVLLALPFVYGVGGSPRTAYLLSGTGTIICTSLYLLSPMWRSVIEVSGHGLRVTSPSGKLHFATEFSTLERIFVDDEEQAMMLLSQSGATFLLPSPAHKAPYRITGQPALYSLLLERLPPEKIAHTRVFS